MSDAILAALAAADIHAEPRPSILSNSDGGVFGVSVAGSNAIAAWQVCRGLFPETSLWPVLAGGEDEFEHFSECFEFDAAPPFSQIDEVKSIDAEDWFRKRATEEPEYYQPEHGEWPEEAEPADWHTIPTDILSGKFLDSVNLLLPKVLVSYLVPIHLQYGGWNECPFPAEHAAVHRYWDEHYGAEIVGMTPDVIECRVARPPATREAALNLAMQQYIYCTDIVDQGTQTIEYLAATLLNGKTWYFWWD